MVLLRWTETEFFEQLCGDPINRHYEPIAREILKRTKDLGILEWCKVGETFAGFTTRLKYRGKEHRFYSVCSSTQFPKGHPKAGKVWGANGVEILFQFMKPPFEPGSLLQSEARKQFNVISGFELPPYEAKQGGKRPNTAFRVFQNQENLNQFFDVIEWMIQEIKQNRG